MEDTNKPNKLKFRGNCPNCGAQMFDIWKEVIEYHNYSSFRWVSDGHDNYSENGKPCIQYLKGKIQILESKMDTKQEEMECVVKSITKITEILSSWNSKFGE